MHLQGVRAGCLDMQGAVHRACLSLFTVVVVLVMYRHFWQDKYDINKCDALLARGQWLRTPEPHHSVKGYPSWQPTGCMMHEYNAKDVATCLQSRRVVFIGDSVIRQIFYALAEKLDVREGGGAKHSSISLDTHGLKIEFIWDPYLNTSNLEQEVAAASRSELTNQQVDRAAILLIGGGMWNVRYLGEASYEHFKTSISQITRGLHNGKVTETLLGRIDQSSEGVDDLTVVAPIQVPQYNTLSSERASIITPARVQPIFQHLQQSSVQRNVTVAWSFSHMIRHEPSAYHRDGLHVSRIVAAIMADLLLNARCNAVLRQSNPKGYPMDKTCCNKYERPNWTQSVMICISLCLPTLITIASDSTRGFGFLPSRKVVKAIAVLGLAVCYCYYADRTQLYNKAQKQFSFTEFKWLCAAAFVLGILSMRRSVPTPMSKGSRNLIQNVQDQPFLSRHQTDEWKGWMQFFILIYHYTGASSILWIYEIVRLLVASYIFMTGFGHTVFFYQRSDYSLRRSAAVLIRINMLSCLLPYLMKTDYIFYYFAPLISFWYLVIYLTMAVSHSRNRSWKFLMAKIIISAILTTALIRTPGIFETLFRILEKCFNIHWNVTEWRFRLHLDSCIVYTGILCGIFVVKFMDAQYEITLQDCALDLYIRKNLWILRFTCLAIAAITPPSFYLFARRAPDKYAYNAWFPYSSTAPIIAYVILRNTSRHIRNFHSSIFAWMGRHSLETFTLQYHIWLAADTKGILALGAFERIVGERAGRRVDSAMLTIVFLWVCWHVAAATQTLSSWIVDPSGGMQDVEQDRRVASVEGFPVTRSKQDARGVSRFCRVADAFGVFGTRSASKRNWHVAGGLRMRITIILGLMWLLNLVSSFSARHTSRSKALMTSEQTYT